MVGKSSMVWQTFGPKTVVKYCGYAFGFYCGSSCDLYCGIIYVLWLKNNLENFKNNIENSEKPLKDNFNLYNMEENNFKNNIENFEKSLNDNFNLYNMEKNNFKNFTIILKI